MLEGTLSGLRLAYETFDNGINDQECPDCDMNRKLIFLHAVTRTAMVLIDNNDISIDSFLELAHEFGVTVTGDYFIDVNDLIDPNDLIDVNVVLDANGYYRIPEGAPNAVELGEAIQYVIIPEINDIIGELDSINDSPNDRFRIFFEPNDTGLKNDLEVDYGEVLILKGLLLAFKGQLETKLAYDIFVDVNEALMHKLLYEDGIEVNDANIADLLAILDANDINNPSVNEDFLNRYPYLLMVLPTPGHDEDGAAILAQAAQDWINGINYYFDAIDYIRSEDDPPGTDPQEDELLYIDPNDEEVLDNINARLTTLRDSLINDTVGTYPWETSKIYYLQDPCSTTVWELTLNYDVVGLPTDEVGSFIASDINTAPTPWEVTDIIIDGNEIILEMDYDVPGYWGGALFTGILSDDGNNITNGTFEYWGPDYGTIYNLSGQLVTTEVVERQLDLNPVFGSSSRYPEPVNLRDLLPEFDDKDMPISGTFGHGLGDDPTLGGILPGMTQEEWAILFDLAEFTYFVDDDANNDPGPGDPNISDPNEDGSRQHPFDAIQEAINAATDGNTIGVLDGIYTGNGNRNIDFGGRAITVCSQNGPNDCIIDCEDANRAFYFHSEEIANSILDGFTITNGYSGEGGGIYCNSSSPTVKNCIFSGNSASTIGGGMYNYNNSPTVTNCTFIGNSGGGMANDIFSSPVVTSCRFINNFDDYGGGGIYNHWYSNPTLTFCTFTGNSAGQFGGAMHNGLYCDPSISNCTFSGNSAGAGGGAMFNNQASPILDNCTFSGNDADNKGGAMHNYQNSSPILTDCNITGNYPDGIRTEDSNVWIGGTVQVVSNDLTGDGTLQIDPNSILELEDSGISCDVIGTGMIHIPVGTELVIENDAVIDLNDPCDPNNKGTILCDGLLRARDNARITNANINVTRANLLGPSPYGQFFIEDSAEIVSNDINSQDDRYLDFDPNAFNGTIEDNKIHITITEGANDTPSRLLELRGQDFLAEPLCEPNEYFCEVNEVPPFDVNSWTAELLEVPAGTRVKLTNRFDFGNGGSYEVMYVKNLILGPGCELDTAFNKLYYENLQGDPNAVKNKALLGYPLGRIDVDDPNEFNIRVTHNNFIHPEEPNYTRVHVERITGVELDPNGVMLMRNLPDQDPCSPTYGQVINARAKGLFTKSSEDFILIRFQYLFGASTPDLELPDLELVVYLCDVPDFLAHDDPERDNHYIEFARIPVPPPGRPGSVSSGRFAVFYKSVYRGDLNLTESTRVELELVELQGGGPLFYGGKELKTMSKELKTMSSEGGGSVIVNNLDAGVYCAWDRWFCADINFSDTVDEEDYLTVVGGYGEPEGLGSEEEGGRGCMEGPFSDNDHLDSLDIAGWDWTLDSSNRFDLCKIPLTGLGGSSAASSQSTATSQIGPLVSLPALSDLLIAGKRGTSTASNKLKDRLYVFDSNNQYVGWFAPASQRCNIKLVRGPEGELYQINAETGILRLDDTNEVIVPPSTGGIVLTEFNEPRYDEAATVYVGLQGAGANTYGRPIIDAAFDDANDANYVYIVPVVVEPSTSEPYTAVAKLNLDTPPYSIIKLYDTAPSAGDREYRNSLREIELDGAGNLYLINAHAINENDMLWKFNTDTAAITGTINLGNPATENYVPDPIGMFVSATEKMIYLASGQRNQADANAAVIHGFSTETLTHQRSIPISGMHFATSITGHPSRGLLWVAGFDMNDLQGGSPNPYIEPFYHPYLAQIPHDVNVPDYVMSLLGSDDLALPMSIVWTGTELKCDGADLDGIGNVNFDDFAIFAPQWHQTPGTPSADIGPVPGGDGAVNLVDLAVFANHWLESGCN
jgi:hypothetical protein